MNHPSVRFAWIPLDDPTSEGQSEGQRPPCRARNNLRNGRAVLLEICSSAPNFCPYPDPDARSNTLADRHKNLFSNGFIVGSFFGDSPHCALIQSLMGDYSTGSFLSGAN